MIPALAPETLQSAGVLYIFGIALCTCWCLGTSPTLWSSGYPTCSRRAASGGVLAQASPTIVGAGQTGVFLSICPLPQSLILGLFGALAGQVPCSALFRAAINQAIWSPSCFEPSDISVAADDGALTLSFASSVSLLAFLAVTISWEYVVFGLPWRYVIESHICLYTLWNSWSLRWHATSQSAILRGHFSWFGWEYPPALWWRRALSHVTLSNLIKILHEDIKWCHHSENYW